MKLSALWCGLFLSPLMVLPTYSVAQNSTQVPSLYTSASDVIMLPVPVSNTTAPSAAPGAVDSAAVPGGNLPPDPALLSTPAVVAPNAITPAPVFPDPTAVNTNPSGTILPSVTSSAPPSPTDLPVSSPVAPLPPLPLQSLTPKEKEDEFNEASARLLGLSPDQIRAFRLMLDDRAKAEAEVPGDAPKGSNVALTLSLSPGTAPPTLKLFRGLTTSLTLVDATGAAWPVENFRVGNQVAFPVNRLDGAQGSTFTLDTSVMYGHSNVAMKLAGVSAPIVLDLVAGEREYHSSVELRIQSTGPNAHLVHRSLPPAVNSALASVLDGVAPTGGHPLSVEGWQDVKAWKMPDGTLLVRSPVKIVSPASQEMQSSASGYHVYRFPLVSQLRAIHHQSMIPLRVVGL